MSTTNPLDTQVGGDHYKKLGQYQPWEVLSKWLTPDELRGYAKGTVIAYLARERDKGGIQDIDKALHTLQLYQSLRPAESPTQKESNTDVPVSQYDPRERVKAFQSNALWPNGVFCSKHADNISTDTHYSWKEAEHACNNLSRYGRLSEGCASPVYPLATWVSPIQQPPIVPEVVDGTNRT